MSDKEPHWVIAHTVKVIIGVVVTSALFWFGLTNGVVAPPGQPDENVKSEGRTVNLDGLVLTMAVPSWWLANPKRGSVDFSNHQDIETTKLIRAGLSVRSEGTNPKWLAPDPSQVLATLSEDEHLCDITNAADNGSRFYLGFQAHCQELGVCAYDIEGTKLRVTIKSAELKIARSCPK